MAAAARAGRGGDNAALSCAEDVGLSATLTPPAMPSTPSPLALKLGYAGLAPFVGGAALVWLVRPEVLPLATAMLSAYAAVIVSFLGGVHWGLAMRPASQPAPPALLLWGVVPALLAWPAVLMPAYAGLVAHGVVLVLCYLVDRRTYPRAGAAGWLMLRWRLTLVASLSCFLAAAGS
jgi:hypothetical protein